MVLGFHGYKWMGGRGLKPQCSTPLILRVTRTAAGGEVKLGRDGVVDLLLHLLLERSWAGAVERNRSQKFYGHKKININFSAKIYFQRLFFV